MGLSNRLLLESSASNTSDDEDSDVQRCAGRSGLRRSVYLWRLKLRLMLDANIFANVFKCGYIEAVRSARDTLAELRGCASLVLISELLIFGFAKSAELNWCVLQALCDDASMRLSHITVPVSAYRRAFQDGRVLAADSWRLPLASSHADSGRRHRLQINVLCSHGEEYHHVGIFGATAYIDWLEKIGQESRLRFENLLRGAVADAAHGSILRVMQSYQDDTHGKMPSATGIYSVPWCARAVSECLGLRRMVQIGEDRYAGGMSDKNRDA